MWHCILHLLSAARQDHFGHRHLAELGPAQPCAPGTHLRPGPARPTPPHSAPRALRPRRPGRDTRGGRPAGSQALLPQGSFVAVAAAAARAHMEGAGAAREVSFSERDFREEQERVPLFLHVRAGGRGGAVGARGGELPPAGGPRAQGSVCRQRCGAAGEPRWAGGESRAPAAATSAARPPVSAAAVVPPPPPSRAVVRAGCQAAGRKGRAPPAGRWRRAGAGGPRPAPARSGCGRGCGTAPGATAGWPGKGCAG